MLQVRPGTSLDAAAALDVWTVDRGARGLRSGGPRATALRDLLRAPTSLVLLAEDRGAVVGLLVATLGRADDAGVPVGDGDGPVVPGLLHLSALAVVPSARGAARALLSSLLGRYPWVTAWADPSLDAGPLELLGFAPTGAEREGAVHLERRPPGLTPAEV